MPCIAGVANEGAERLALCIDQLHKRVLVQTVAEALEGAVHRQDPVALENAPGLAYVAVFVTASATFARHLSVPKVISPKTVQPQGKTLYTQI